MYAFILRTAVIVCSVVIEFLCFIIQCCGVCEDQSVSDPLTAVFVPSGMTHDPHIVACEHLIPYHTHVVLSC